MSNRTDFDIVAGAVSAPELEELLVEMAGSPQLQHSVALLCWHRLYRWPALREIDRKWPMLRVVP